MQPPPPRKGNYAKFLKNLHGEQLAKLQTKNQHECDLLEDIRTFTLKRSAVEKSYSEALLKISTAYLNKKIPNIPDIKYDGGEEKWNMWNVWRTVLEENEKLARARLAAVELFQQQIADEAKTLRLQKLQNTRKIVDNLTNHQKELQNCVQDLDKTKKLYFDEERNAKDVRDRAKDIEEKLKKKKGSFFQSITSLQKTGAKVSSKKEQLEVKSSGARNEYILSLAATNAHQNHYFLVDLQSCLLAMENNIFDKVSEFLTLMGRTELLTCSATQHSFSKIRDQAQQLSREYNLQCCFLYYPVLKQHIQYEFEACDNDPIRKITAEKESAAEILNNDARKWATRIARDNNTMKDCAKKLLSYLQLKESGQKADPNDPNGPDLDTKIDETKEMIRKAEIHKLKAVARIECLRIGGVNVDEWIQEAELLSNQDMQRSASSQSVHTEDQPSSDSFYDSDFGDGEGQQQAVQSTSSIAEPGFNGDSEDEETNVDDMVEEKQQVIEDLSTGWDDGHFNEDWGTSEVQPPDQVASDVLFKCTALFSYTADNPDELSIVENEQLEIISEGDGDGWLRARNYRGEEGYVPYNYLEKEQTEEVATQGVSGQISFSSVDYTVDQEDEGFSQDQEHMIQDQFAPKKDQSPDQVSVITIESKPIIFSNGEEEEENKGVCLGYCFSLYDYEAIGDDELSFEEGLIISIFNRNANGIDDGWWEGELEGKRGKFPSMLVEECDENGEPLTNDEDNCDGDRGRDGDDERDDDNVSENDENGNVPTKGQPPLFTPPDIPEEYKSESTEMFVSDSIMQQQNGVPFSMELKLDQQEQYNTQFNAKELKEKKNKQEKSKTDGGSNGGLSVAQIIVTAATPMNEIAHGSFPVTDSDVKSGEDDVGTEEEKRHETEGSSDESSPSEVLTAKHVSMDKDSPPDAKLEFDEDDLT